MFNSLYVNITLDIFDRQVIDYENEKEAESCAAYGALLVFAGS